jgi:hypothetical protein
MGLSSYFSRTYSPYYNKGLKMIAEILSTGDEVCFGAIVDSNAAHIAAVLIGFGD